MTTSTTATAVGALHQPEWVLGAFHRGGVPHRHAARLRDQPWCALFHRSSCCICLENAALAHVSNAVCPVAALPVLCPPGEQPCANLCIVQPLTHLQRLIPHGSFDRAEALYLIEGAGQVGLGLSWGDGFAHARSLLAADRYVSDPSDFYRSLVRGRMQR